MSLGKPFRDSIRARAALLTSVLVTVALAAFTWFTVARVQADLIKRGMERAQTAASSLAAQTAQTSAQGLARMNQIASGPVIAAAVRTPNEQTKSAAIAAVSATAPGGTTQEQLIEIWDAAGRRIFSAAVPAEAASLLPLDPAAPPAAGLMPLRTNKDVLFSRTVAEIPDDPAHPAVARLGYLVVSRVVRPTPNTTALLNGLVGTGASLLIGNQSGSVWTDLGRVVPAPMIDLSKPGGREFLGSNGEREVGAPVNIAGTPWVLLVAFPRSVILSPARQLLLGLSAASVVIILLATFAARALSSRVTEPLGELTRAAQAIERGDYSSRVIVQGRDEVGQLAHAFNAMAEQVESGRRALELHASELSLSREEARQANESKDEFLAVLSHELRTPLNAILGWCQMLDAGVTPPGGTAHAVAVIKRNATAQLRLVEDLLDVSRIVAGRFVLEKELVDPGLIVNAAVEAIQPALTAKELTVAIGRLPGVEAAFLFGDAGRLQQAVWNLLSNAIKFTPRGGRVRIEMKTVGTSLEIAVRDNGEGISADALPFIFERLQQGDNGTARRHGGLGLGLAIVRQIVELHQGTVVAESDGAGLGSTFRIRLPTTKSPEVAKSLAARTAVLAGTETARVVEASVRDIQILLVEDSDDARELLFKLLTGEGANVTAFAGAEVALDWLQANRPDVIVSDIEMPRMDGWEMVRALRASPYATNSVPAIALTAHATPGDRDRSMSAGFQEHLTKPVDFPALLATIARLAVSAAVE